MSRTKRGKVAVKRRKIILRLTRGFQGSLSKLFRTANQKVIKSFIYAYIGRKQRKRVFRRLWIVRINAAVRIYDLTYNQFISGLKKKKISLNKKMLAQLAITDLPVFCILIELVKNII